MTDTLSAIQRVMAFMGWKGDVEKGFSHKEDVDGNRIATHHDATWIADVEEACERVNYQALIAEFERREAIKEQGQ